MERNWRNGKCWRCEASDVPVLWIGPAVSLEYGEAPLYCYLPCVRRMEEMLREHNWA